ncbi:hypothetical protein [Achromobacter pestifer]|uniref:Phasin family protein n=1 Tax=Achromobacter pestifer TaxID=1353889 RepID=A0A6S6YW17_9BURK|nr:hypothetical protein [Achromobacter pestifer]CAB3641995.1 hypothetical protein LMG3431_02187 [Achromobacter pestifer]
MGEAREHGGKNADAHRAQPIMQTHATYHAAMESMAKGLEFMAKGLEFMAKSLEFMAKPAMNCTAA